MMRDQQDAIDAAAELLCIATSHQRDKNNLRLFIRLPYEDAVKEIEAVLKKIVENSDYYNKKSDKIAKNIIKNAIKINQEDK